FLIQSVKYGRQQLVVAFDDQEQQSREHDMNSVKETVKKTNKSPATKSAELSSPAAPSPRIAPNNSSIDVKKVLSPKPAAPASIPQPAAAKVSTIAAKMKDANPPAPQSFAPASTPDNAGPQGS